MYYCGLYPLVAYVRLHTNLGDLNLELHSDQVNCLSFSSASVYVCVCVCVCACVHVCGDI